MIQRRVPFAGSWYLMERGKEETGRREVAAIQECSAKNAEVQSGLTGGLQYIPNTSDL